MEEKKEKNKNEMKLVEIQTKVRDLIKLDYSPNDLKQMVEVSSKIEVPNLEDKGQLKIAKEMRTKLRKAEIVIEKQVKNYRSFFNTINDDISAGGADLKKITTPEIERLDKIQEEAKALELKKEREALLPIRKERLREIDDTGCYIPFDDNLMEMDSDAFEKYFNECVANKNERDRARQETIQNAQRIREEENLKKQRFDFRVEKLKSIGFQADNSRAGFSFDVLFISFNEIEESDNDTFDAKFASLQGNAKVIIQNEKEKQEKEARREHLPERLKRLGAIGDNVPVSEDVILGMDDNQFDAYVNKRVADKNQADLQAIEDKKKADEQLKKDMEEAERHEKEEKERLEKEEEEKKAKLEKQKLYKKFLKEHGWTPESRDQFESREVEGGYELWKRVGIFSE